MFVSDKSLKRVRSTSTRKGDFSHQIKIPPPPRRSTNAMFEEYYGRSGQLGKFAWASLLINEICLRGKEMIMTENVVAKTVVLVHGGFVDGSAVTRSTCRARKQ